MGAHQLDNAAAAVTAALALARNGFERITHAAILEGLNCAALPGRFQVDEVEGALHALMLSHIELYVNTQSCQHAVLGVSRIYQLLNRR